VDADLNACDVRMTMGGEPTFVSIDDMDGADGITAAIGPMKYKRADILVRRLRDRFATGGLLHHGMANGIPANLCRAGRWDSIGARMASRFGRMHLCWPMKALPAS